MAWVIPFTLASYSQHSTAEHRCHSTGKQSPTLSLQPQRQLVLQYDESLSAETFWNYKSVQQLFQTFKLSDRLLKRMNCLPANM